MAAIAFAVTAAVREVVTDDDGDAPVAVERTGSARDDTLGRVDHDAPAPQTWRIRFLLATPGTEQTEVVTVRAPFDSHTEVRVGGEFRELRETALGIAVTRPDGAPTVGLAPPPEAAGLRPGPVMADAAAAGLVERRETRRVAGRPCQVYRTDAVFSGTTFAPPASARDYVDLCVDRAGLLLESVEYFEGRIIRQRVAVRVELNVAVADDDVRELAHDQTLRAIDGGGSFRAVDPASQPVGPFFVLDTPPEGFTRQGRYEVIPPQPDITSPETRGTVVAAMSDVFVRGGDVMVIEQGSRLDKSDPWERDDRFPDLDLGPELRTGEFLASTNGAEVRSVLESGRFVRVYGTVSRATLESVARALRRTESGTGPVYVDG